MKRDSFIQVQVLLFASARDLVGSDSIQVRLPESSTVEKILSLPELAALANTVDSLRFAVNEEFANLSTRMRHGDVVAIVPPVSGG